MLIPPNLKSSNCHFLANFTDGGLYLGTTAMFCMLELPHHDGHDQSTFSRLSAFPPGRSSSALAALSAGDCDSPSEAIQSVLVMPAR